MSDKPVRVLLPEAMAKGLSRRIFLGGALGLGVSATLAACSTGGGGGSSSGGLNIYTWGEYDDPDVLKAFTADNGAAITIDSYGSNQEMISKLVTASGTSGYDLCVPTHQYIPQMAASNLLEELDHSKLPNMENLDPAYIDQEFDPGNKYSVPKDWGSTGFVYDTTIITRELTSWADFWDAAQNEASGKLSLLEDPGEIAYAYFLWKGIDPNTTDEGHLEEYRVFITETIAPHVQAFESYPSGTIAQNGRTLAHAWNGDARQGILNNADRERYRYVTPSEGGNLWQDNWAIVKGAPNADAAHEFINYVLDPEVSLQELVYIGYNTAVTGIEEMAADAGVEMPELIFFTDEQVDKLVFAQLTDAEQTIVSIYDELTAAAGQ
ncbi:spermidine/putrescine transport system substrate-binding protein [Labedella gwakjiensis]|uniref:Spermidine/putrescine ABC transporter substrate-binding protein n=1 Tax=Labedella gwakjiensis TaxID=390269 RepID=A0A2P8GSJ8_9MICO|nr:spermidine/putrescine ABC transporter substrate-binding protein [Labedella gwakjiensis]PSL36946.1 spermidine/putrescine transport system substrate-binding protein [Labedella gwakjiensis]RUQ81750.1 spermidine/putrescine ABC transporter substrate-binding protein [Labedella gwakjiensis]